MKSTAVFSALWSLVAAVSHPWLDSWLNRDTRQLSVVILNEVPRVTDQLVASLHARGDLSVRVTNGTLNTRGDTGQAHLLIAADVKDVIIYVKAAWAGTQYGIQYGYPMAFHPSTNVLLIIARNSSSCGENNLPEYTSLLRRLWQWDGLLNVALIEEDLGMCRNSTRNTFFTFNPFIKINNLWDGELEIRHADEFPALSAVFRVRLNNLNGYVMDALVDQDKDLLDMCRMLGVNGETCLTIPELLLKELSKRMNAVFIKHDYLVDGNRTLSEREAQVRADIVHFNGHVQFVAKEFGYYENFATYFEIVPPISKHVSLLAVPKASLKSPFFLPFRCFPLSVWSLLLITYVCVSIAWHFLCKFFSSFRANSVPTSFSIMLHVFSSAGLENFSRIKSHAQRVLLAVCLLSCGVVVVNTYLSVMVGLIIDPGHEPDIDTHQQLVNSQLLIRTYTDHPYLFQGSPYRKELRNKLVINVSTDENDILRTIFYQRDAAMIIDRDKAELAQEVLVEFQRSLHIMEEPAGSFLAGYTLKKTSAFATRFNRIINSIVDSGVDLIWKENMRVINNRVINSIVSREQKRFALSDLSFAFFIWITGIVVSFFVFILENISARTELLKFGNWNMF